MRKTPHFKRASKRFLDGTRCKTPFEAVQTGIRTLEEWVMVLEEERIVEMEFVQARVHRRHRQTNPTRLTQRA